jgi:hypothetical protein
MSGASLYSWASRLSKTFFPRGRARIDELLWGWGKNGVRHPQHIDNTRQKVGRQIAYLEDSAQSPEIPRQRSARPF